MTAPTDPARAAGLAHPARPTGPAPTWHWRTFDALGAAGVHAVLQLRARIFVVEQQCVFLEVDGRDPDAFHLLGTVDTPLAGDVTHGEGAPPSAAAADAGDARLAAYARVFAPGAWHADAAVIGRVVTHPASRGTGVGHRLMREAVARVRTHWPGAAMRLEAQQHLAPFYAAHGFATCGPSYLEDGIPHVPMRRPAV